MHVLSSSFAVPLMAGNKTYRVDGRFLLHDPWWEVTCTIRQGRHKNFVKGFPSYRLRTNLGTEGQSLMSLFLTACGAQPDFVNMFMEWLPNDRYVEPVNVLDVLQDFEDSSPENKAVAEQLKSKVNRSGWKTFAMFTCIIYLTHKVIFSRILHFAAIQNICFIIKQRQKTLGTAKSEVPKP